MLVRAEELTLGPILDARASFFALHAGNGNGTGGHHVLLKAVAMIRAPKIGGRSVGGIRREFRWQPDGPPTPAAASRCSHSSLHSGDYYEGGANYGLALASKLATAGS